MQQAPKRDPKKFLTELEGIVISIVNARLPERFFDIWNDRVTQYDELIGERIREIPEEPPQRLELKDRGLAEIAAISRSYLGCELFVAGEGK